MRNMRHLVLLALCATLVTSYRSFHAPKSLINVKSQRGLTREIGQNGGSIRPINSFSDVNMDNSRANSALYALNIPENTEKSVESQYDLSPQQFMYVILTSIFVTCLIIADVIGVKLFDITLPFEIFGKKTIEHTCGMLTFPVTFVLGDLINEYYGPKAAKNTVFIGLAMSIFVFLIMNVAQAMPYLDKPFNVTPESFNMIFGSAKLMYVASVTAYLIGSLSDIWLFGVIKKATNGKLLWLRATGSTVISQILDSFVVSYVAFSLGKSLTGQTPATFDEIINIASTGYGLKFALSFGMTPFLYILKNVMSENFGLQPLPVAVNSEEKDV
jgi:uncharacterized integral membrane protein (TIGR00697 family)